MNSLFNRWLPCLTLAAWSAVLLVFQANGKVKDLLAPQFRTYALIAGIVLGLMAIIFLFFKVDTSCCSSAECGHSLSRRASGRILTFLVLLLPLSVAATFSPTTFGKTLVENRGITDDISTLGLKERRVGPPPDLKLPTKDEAQPASTPQPVAAVQNGTPPAPDSPGANAPGAPAANTPGTSTQPPASEPAATDYLTRTPEGNIVAEVLDLLYAAQDTVLRKDFEGKRVELIGQIMPDKTSAEQSKRFKAVRMFMTCCAADARPIATLVETDKLPDFPEMTWIKVTGTPTFPTENGRRVSVLKAEKIEKTDPPDEAMLF
jgi:uncharacterized repeat protein (TIGR03943 family)